jgi:PspC domain-containing protein
VLWRILLAVLTLFGGVGLLVYLIGWLVIPAEGDTASPIEAVFGQGRSSTSTPVVIAVAAGTVIVFGIAFSGDLRATVLGAAVIVGAALLSRNVPVSRSPQGAVPPPAPTAPGPDTAPPGLQPTTG